MVALIRPFFGVQKGVLLARARQDHGVGRLKVDRQRLPRRQRIIKIAALDKLEPWPRLIGRHLCGEALLRLERFHSLLLSHEHAVRYSRVESP
jgi:hypothetical protein